MRRKKSNTPAGKKSRARATPDAARERVTSAPTPPAAKGRMLYVLSDSTGNLARHMLAAFLTQFPRDAFKPRFKNFLRTEANVNAAFEEIRAAPGLVVHAVMSAALKDTIHAHGRKLDLPVCDLTGPFVEFLSRESGISPDANHRRLHDVDAAYHHRIRTMEFTLEHDDGLGLDTLDEADIVLVGVSRTSKTPTSIYLAQQGHRVANVSLAQEVQPPQQLLTLAPRKVVALVIDPEQLAEIRTRRQTGWRMATTSYNDPEHVRAEMAWARRLYARQGWPILDVTDQAIEETAARILAIVGLEQASAS
jgi:[pyruvate, water dikinase]-phosphate phosphotransferase / [pyruvate, water dikinase] kinase